MSISDTQITLANADQDQQFCFPSCTGPFSGFGFYFSSGADITKVTVDSSSTFKPIANGLSYDGTSVTVNLQSETLNKGDTLVLDVTTGGGGGGGGTVPEPSTWAMLVLGFVGLGFAGWRRAVHAA